MPNYSTKKLLTYSTLLLLFSIALFFVISYELQLLTDPSSVSHLSIGGTLNLLVWFITWFGLASVMISQASLTLLVIGFCLSLGSLFFASKASQTKDKVTGTALLIGLDTLIGLAMTLIYLVGIIGHIVKL